MKINNLIYILLIGIVSLLSSCDDDDSIFSGNENYITSFSLEKDGLKFAATISEEKISLTVPRNISLENATVKIQTSENAKISPDPSSIKDWSNIQIFTVTSHNGKQKREYSYEIERTGLTEEGDVVLTTQTEVKEFADKSIQFIKGGLIVGKSIAEAEDEDPISSLKELSMLKGISGNITINTSYTGGNLSGLENLESANSLVIAKNGSVESVNLPKLVTLKNNLTIESNGMKEIFLPSLKNIGGNISVTSTAPTTLQMGELEVVAYNVTLSGKVANVEMSKLKTIGQDLNLSNLPELTSFDLPLLTRLGNINISNTPKLENLSLASLEKIPGNLSLNNLGALQTINLSSVIEIIGNFRIQQLAKLTTINAEKLEVVNGQFTLNNLPLITNLSGFKSLKIVNNNMTLSYLTVGNFTGLESLEYIKGTLQLSYNNSVNSLEGFESLTSIQNELQLYSMPLLTKFDGFPKLQSVKILNINALNGVTNMDIGFPSLVTISDVRMNNCNFTQPFKFSSPSKSLLINSIRMQYMTGSDIEIDMSGQAVGELILYDVGKGNVILKGPEIFDGDVEITKSQNDFTLTIEGIKEIKNLKFSVYGTTEQTINVPSIEKVTGAFNYSVGNECKVKTNFVNLKEVGGEFSLSGGYTGFAYFPKIAQLKKIGGFTYGTGVLSKIDMPSLETVSGNMSISTAWQNGSLVYEIEEINLPSLKTIDGTFTLKSSTANKTNTKLTNLNFLSSLQTVGAIDIKSQSALVDFQGLANALGSLTDGDSWDVSNNGYNPTFEQAKAGQLTKP